MISSSAMTWPLPKSPPSRLISVMRSIISMGGAGELGIARTEIAALARPKQILLRVRTIAARESREGWARQTPSAFGLTVAKRHAIVVAIVFFDAGARSQAQGSGHECPNFIREFPRIRALFAHQGADQRLANSADHQRNGEMRIDWTGNEAVTLRRLDHACAAGELLAGESSLDIEHFGCAAQGADDEGSEGWL